ncbi:MAG: peptidyl-prolyl cis-trans isomerase [Marinilabiliales bacterium]|nr:peptidyl-prolyl cis-trans isomerase [Marinilabiliales bacterium]
MTNSEDQGSAQIGGDLGWFPEGRMVVPFNNACFAAKKGEILLLETTFGIHIIEVLDQSKKSRKYDIGIVDRKITCKLHYKPEGIQCSRTVCRNQRHL